MEETLHLSAKMSEQIDVISPIELEDIVNILHPTLELERIGNREWSRQMSMMEELNVQAAVEAGRGGEENVRQVLVESQKMPLIVHEVLVTEIWRENVLPRILKQGKPESSFQVVIYKSWVYINVFCKTISITL